MYKVYCLCVGYFSFSTPNNGLKEFEIYLKYLLYRSEYFSSNRIYFSMFL